MPTILCDYGYDVHSAEISDEIAELIRARQSVSFAGQGFNHEIEGIVHDQWLYLGTSDSLIITLNGDAEIIGHEFWIEQY